MVLSGCVMAFIDFVTFKFQFCLLSKTSLGLFHLGSLNLLDTLICLLSFKSNGHVLDHE